MASEAGLAGLLFEAALGGFWALTVSFVFFFFCWGGVNHWSRFGGKGTPPASLACYVDAVVVLGIYSLMYS